MSTKSPVLGRRRLARVLRRRRLCAERTIVEVAEHLECSPAKVSRMETGAVGIRTQDLRALVELYGIEDPEREQLYTLVRQARRRSWWDDYSDSYPPGSETLFSLEDASSGIAVHSPSLIPGLLQTPAYCATLIGSTGLKDDVARRRVELRQRRQQILARAQPPELHALLDEAVLCRTIGEPAVMAQQLEHLLEAGQRANIEIRVLEFTSDVHPGLGVAFTLFDFDIPAVASVAYQEQLFGNTYADDPDQVRLFRDAWHKAESLAATPQRSHEIIASRLHALR